MVVQLLEAPISLQSVHNNNNVVTLNFPSFPGFPCFFFCCGKAHKRIAGIDYMQGTVQLVVYTYALIQPSINQTRIYALQCEAIQDIVTVCYIQFCYTKTNLPYRNVFQFQQTTLLLSQLLPMPIIQLHIHILYSMVILGCRHRFSPCMQSCACTH